MSNNPENFEYAYDYSEGFDENFTIPIYFENKEDETKLLILISEIATILEKSNLILCIIGLFFNLLNFLVMSRKKMRNSSINILMIGISICDIFIIGNTVGSHIYHGFYMDKCWPKESYSSRIVLLFLEVITNLLLRLSPWLGLSMAMIRATVILFPWSTRIQALSEKSDGIKVLLSVFGMSFVITAFLFARFSIFKNGDWVAPEKCGYPLNYTQTRYIVLVGRKVIFSDKTSMKLYGIVNGASSIIPAVLYPVIAGVLAVQLLKLKNNHDKLFSRRENAEKDHTTKLVILMTITFFISQFPIGLSMWLRLIFPYHNVINYALDHGKEITSILFTINATSHCIIFATLSSKYREVAKEVFCWNKSEIKVSTRSGVFDSQKIK